jgi:hypothetical protein
MSVGESKVKWVDSARIGICIAAKLLQQCVFSNNVLASKQRIVDTTKVYGMIAEIWMLHSEVYTHKYIYLYMYIYIYIYDYMYINIYTNIYIYIYIYKYN